MKSFSELESLPRYVFQLKVLCDRFEIKYKIDKEKNNFYYSHLDVRGEDAVKNLIEVIADIEYQHPSWKVENSF